MTTTSEIPENAPVIIGSSLTGLLISLSLSREGIKHVLIGGGPPNDVPRLGESLNECAGPALWREFGNEIQDCFYTKSHISLFNGPFFSMVYLSNPGRSICAGSNIATKNYDRSPSLWKLLASALLKGTTILHLDRIRFDPMVYKKALSKDECHFVNGMVENVQIENDHVTNLTLADGQQIGKPLFVFDSVGFRSPVVEAAKVETEALSNRQRVIWAHYQTENGEVPKCGKYPHWWLKGTNLLRLDRENDGVDGISWLIPLGDTISVGVSVDDERYGKAEFEKLDILKKTDEAWRRRGVDYRSDFPRHERATPEIVHRYYKRERSFGSNWMLPGASYISIWFPSSAGLWTTMAACRLAPKFLEDPVKAGRNYEEILTGSLTGFHDHLDRMIHGPVFEKRRQLFKFWSKWLSAVPFRFSDYLQLESPDREHVLFKPLKTVSRWMSRSSVLSFYLIYLRREPDLQRQGKTPKGYYQRAAFHIRNIVCGPAQYLKCDFKNEAKGIPESNPAMERK